MNKILLKIKKICIVAGVLSALFLATYFFISIQKCSDKPVQQVAKNENLITEETYRPPIVKIPFTKSPKQPIKDKDLPIPKKDVDKTIEITVPPSPKPKKIKIVIDKDGKIYKSKDTPKDIKIEVTKWRPRLIDIKPRFGYSLVYQGQAYHCLTLDVLRIGKFYAGGEAGISMNNYDLDGYLLGLSGKYHCLTFDFFGGAKIYAFAALGYNFLDKKIYAGVTLRW